MGSEVQHVGAALEEVGDAPGAASATPAKKKKKKKKKKAAPAAENNPVNDELDEMQ